MKIRRPSLGVSKVDVSVGTRRVRVASVLRRAQGGIAADGKSKII